MDQEGLVLMKGGVKFVFNIKIMTKISVLFCVYLKRDHKISAILSGTSMAKSIEKAHIMTGHHDEEQTHKIAMELGVSLKRNC